MPVYNQQHINLQTMNQATQKIRWESLYVKVSMCTKLQCCLSKYVAVVQPKFVFTITNQPTHTTKQPYSDFVQAYNKEHHRLRLFNVRFSFFQIYSSVLTAVGLFLCHTLCFWLTLFYQIRFMEQTSGVLSNPEIYNFQKNTT